MCCFVRQTTAYEMRISDWSSDLCSSDLGALVPTDDVQALAAALVEVLIEPRRSACGTRARTRSAAYGVEQAATNYWARIEDRQSVVYGKRLSVRVDLGGRRIMKKKNQNTE